MKHHSVYGIATSQGQAESIVRRLTAAGFDTDDISALFPDTRSSHAFAHELHTKAPEGAVAGAAAGGALAGSLGLLAGLGALAIPGAGPLLAAGPVMAALSAAAVGATFGGVAGALIGMGIPEIEAKRYEGSIRDGNILVSVHTASRDEAAKAREILVVAGAAEICESAVDPAPGSEAEPVAHVGRPKVGTPMVEPVTPPVMPKDEDLL